MRKLILFTLFFCWWASLGTVSFAVAQQSSSFEYEYLLETPSWGMLEWGSATLPQGYWYPTVELMYVYSGTYFKEGKEQSVIGGGRDSSSLMLNGSLLFGVTNKLTAGVYIPVVLDQKVDSGGDYASSKKVKSGTSDVGDVQLFLKYRLFDRYYWGLATQVGVTLPSGQAYDKVDPYKESGTGDGQTDLNMSIKGDILISDYAFVTACTWFSHQFKRSYLDTADNNIEEKLGDVLGFEAGFVRNSKDFGMGGNLSYTWWASTKWNDVVKNEQADLFSLQLRFSIGNLTPRKHGKIGFVLDFPLTGKNAAATYRIGINIQSIFR
jgi:hypothetical protein